MKTEHSAGAVLYRKDNGNISFLLVRSESGHIGFPKGHLEKGETVSEAALREIREETGIVLDGIDESFCFENEYMLSNGNLKRVTLFIAEYDDSNIVYDRKDLENYLCSYQEAFELLEYEADRHFLNETYNRIRSFR